MFFNNQPAKIDIRIGLQDCRPNPNNSDLLPPVLPKNTIRRRGTPTIPSEAPEPKQLDHALHTNPSRICRIDEIGGEGFFVGETLDKRHK